MSEHPPTPPADAYRIVLGALPSDYLERWPSKGSMALRVQAKSDRRWTEWAVSEVEAAGLARVLRRDSRLTVEVLLMPDPIPHQWETTLVQGEEA